MQCFERTKRKFKKQERLKDPCNNSIMQDAIFSAEKNLLETIHFLQYHYMEWRVSVTLQYHLVGCGLTCGNILSTTLIAIQCQ